MRLVLDTNIVISALIWGGEPRRLLDSARKGEVTLFTSAPLLDELADVLKRDKFAPLLASRGIDPRLLARHYGMLAYPVLPRPIERTVPTDPDDDVVIATALAARAHIIASGDRDLLALHPFREILILNASDTLRLLESRGIKR